MMKKTMIWMTVAGGLLLCLTSCNDYLNIVPKGKKIPRTLAEYEPFLRNEYTMGYAPVTNALYLLNDQYVRKSALNSNTLTRANYLWDETADRILLNNADEGTYNYSYGAISTCNLLLENVPDATDATAQERDEVMAYARVIRAYNYFTLGNYYADTYRAATAAATRSIPLITSANIDAPSQQVSLQELYDFVLEDLRIALETGLPEQSATIIHPNRAAAHALLARIYLQMANYAEALKYANLALEHNDDLFDWRAYYHNHQATIDNPTDYTRIPTPMGYTYVENYYFHHGGGNPNYSKQELSIPVERAARFEEGDLRFRSRWKLRTVNQDTYYESITSGYFNWGGLTTAEMYLVKAECLARQSTGTDFTAAMAALDAVRVTRISAENYRPSQAATLAEAIGQIRRTKENELIFSLVPFADARRFNAEGTYALTQTKVWEGKTYTLTPQSHLWTMPFPAGATQNPGNGVLLQNVSK